jgi:septum formation protein
MKYRFIYLASQSPRRAQLLNQLGVAHRPLLPDPDEDAEALEAVEQGETAEHYVRRVTALKLEAALQRWHRRGLPEAPALCADTTVVLGRRILGKPDGPAQARAMLEALSGRTHRVLTAVAVGLGRQRLAALSVSRVRFEPLTPDAIDAYVRSGEPFGKAGAYAIQSAAAAWVPHIEGSYSGIMGLPLHETASLLRRSKVDFELAVSQG